MMVVPKPKKWCGAERGQGPKSSKIAINTQKTKKCPQQINKNHKKNQKIPEYQKRTQKSQETPS
jgi:hypothetical protein